MTDVPAEVMLPLASGVPADGRTRRFCQVSEQVTPALLAEVMINVRAFVVTVVRATDVPLATPLILKELVPLPPTRVMSTVGWTTLVSKLNPAGALRTTVPTPA